MARTSAVRKTKPAAIVAPVVASRFQRIGELVVDEPGRKLMWTHTLGEKNFKGAQALIDKANAEKLGGYSDWRLPTIEELFCLADRTRSSPAIDKDAFHDTPDYGWYWSSTPYAPGSGYAWGVDFHGGYSHGLAHDYDYGVRAVRASQ